MQEATCGNTRREHTLIKVLGVTVLVFVMLVGIAGAAQEVYNLHNGTVFVIDTATNKVTASVEVGINPCGVAVSPDGKKIYVASRAISHEQETSPDHNYNAIFLMREIIIIGLVIVVIGIGMFFAFRRK